MNLKEHYKEVIRTRLDEGIMSSIKGVVKRAVRKVKKAFRPEFAIKYKARTPEQEHTINAAQEMIAARDELMSRGQNVVPSPEEVRNRARRNFVVRELGDNPTPEKRLVVSKHPVLNAIEGRFKPDKRFKEGQKPHLDVFRGNYPYHDPYTQR